MLCFLQMEGKTLYLQKDYSLFIATVWNQPPNISEVWLEQDPTGGLLGGVSELMHTQHLSQSQRSININCFSY